MTVPPRTTTPVAARTGTPAAADARGQPPGIVARVELPYPDPDLCDEVVRLRRWRLTDIGCIRGAASDPRIPAGATVPSEVTTASGHAFIRRQWSRAERGEGLSLAVADVRTDEACGLVVLLRRPQPGVVGIGYWTVPSARDRGVATHAVRLASTWAVLDAGRARVEAWVEPGNAASLRVLARAGFVREGVLRDFLHIGGRRDDAVVCSLVAGDLGPDS